MNAHPVVFVVDDEEPIRHAFHVLLAGRGIGVQTFPSAEAFLQAYRDDWTGCLFVDVRMPPMSGSELYAELSKRNTTLSIVLMTGHGNKVSLQEMLGSQVTVLEKPFSAVELITIIQRESLQQ